MESPKELSLVEIRKYMLANKCKVTNHALVKHFKRFLTNPDTQNEARKQFKTYVNILSTIKNENDQKYLILRKKYLHECPTEEMALRTDVVPSSPGAMSLVSEGLASPFRQPPPYKPPPEVSSPIASKLPVLQSESADNYRDCIEEFAAAVRLIDSAGRPREESPSSETGAVDDDVKRKSVESEMAVPAAKVKRENSIDSENKENVLRSSISSSETSSSLENSEKTSSDAENPMSVKEATRKFNRMASEEEAKIISPPTKKKPEKVIEEKMTPEVTLSHPKGKEWVVSSAKANYQELAKLASEYPELVKLQDPTTTALHWAAKHGNEDVVKLIAGTYKADVNARTGYTPLHLAMQFGREDIFALLCNVYKANRDLMDWSGNKPLDYHKQRTSVSASTYSSEYDVFMPQLPEKFRNLTAGGTVGFSRKKRSQARYATMSANSLFRTQSLMVNKKRKTIQSMLDEDGLLKPSFSPDRAAITTNNNNEVLSSDSGSPSNNYYGKIPSRRKESFLRKTFRAASNKSEMKFRLCVCNFLTVMDILRGEIKARRKHTEKDLGFLRIGSLNVRVKKTTEAFSNFLGVGNGNGNTNTHATVPAGHQHHPHPRHHQHAITAANPMMRTIKPLGTSTQLTTRASVPINTKNKFEKIHKTWGSADNIPRDGNAGMPPPKGSESQKNRKSKRNNTSECRTTLTGYSSMPTTPNQLRAPIGILSEQVVSIGDSDSDIACGFGSNWSVSRSSLGGSSQSNTPAPRYG